MEIKICDRCRKEINYFSNVHMVIKDSRRGHTDGVMDLCSECYEEFLEFMESKK